MATLKCIVQNFLFQTKENYTALHLAVESGQHEVVETLLGEGANVHIRGDVKIIRLQILLYILKLPQSTY